MIRVYDALKNGYLLNKTIDLSSKTMTLDAAKDLLRHTGTVSGQTISFSNDVWAMILDNEEAVDLLEAAYAKGWGSNEPDITVIANSGYNGVVRVNAADKQLTQVGSTGVWIGSAGTVTALDNFLKHDANYSGYNSTSPNVKKVRFGKNINTASCTTMSAAFRCYQNANNLQLIDLTHISVQSVTNLSRFAQDATGTGKVIKGLENWNPSVCTNFNYFLSNSWFTNDLDLHNWHIASGAGIASMFGALSGHAGWANNPVVYYTPGYWAVDPMNDSNLAADRVKPVVYPYHDITMAVDNASSQTIMVNESSVTAAYDSSLGIAYYDSSVPVTSLTDCVRTNTHIVSISFSKNMQIGSETVGLYRPFEQCTGLRTVNWEIETSPGGYNTLFDRCNVLTNIYGFDKFEERTFGTLFRTFYNTKLRYAALPKMNFTSGIHYSFYSCANLIRISNFPSLPNGINTNNAMYGCTALTTIDACGDIAETIDFADCPLSLASAKVILNALQTVTSETLTFGSTTKGYINADSEALALVTAARNKGWTIAL